MSPTHERRKQRIIDHAEALLPNRKFGHGHNFILSTDEACLVGSAVATRNNKVINEVLSEPILQMDEYYDSFTITELTKEWTAEVQRATDSDATLLEYLTDPTYQAKLDDVLSGRSDEKLEFPPIVMTKLLETILYATSPSGTTEFYPRAVGPRRRISKTQTLYERANYLLCTLADREIGVRTIREGLLADDETTLDSFLENLSRVHLAQKVIAETITKFSDGEADSLRIATLQKLEYGEDDFDELVGTHILTWELLPTEISDRPDRSTVIRDIVTGFAKTEEQRRAIKDEWHDERIDTLFEVAHIGTQQGREAELYISSTFNTGAGLYIAASLTHPLDKEKRIVVADNPINGNALYMVDELLTETDDEGRRYGWREVLGSHKRIARARGARRRYHTGDWSQLSRAVCEYGGDFKLSQQKRREAEDKANAKYLEPPSMSAYEALQTAIERAKQSL